MPRIDKERLQSAMQEAASLPESQFYEVLGVLYVKLDDVFETLDRNQATRLAAHLSTALDRARDGGTHDSSVLPGAIADDLSHTTHKAAIIHQLTHIGQLLGVLGQDAIIPFLDDLFAELELVDEDTRRNILAAIRRLIVQDIQVCDADGRLQVEDEARASCVRFEEAQRTARTAERELGRVRRECEEQKEAIHNLLEETGDASLAQLTSRLSDESGSADILTDQARMQQLQSDNEQLRHSLQRLEERIDHATGAIGVPSLDALVSLVRESQAHVEQLIAATEDIKRVRVDRLPILSTTKRYASYDIGSMTKAARDLLG